jgi:hypothetical protein
MSEQNPNQQTAGESVSHEPCLCREVVDRLHECFDVPPTVRQHLMNSRIEFLKAIREVIDHRIERLSNSGQRGAKIAID